MIAGPCALESKAQIVDCVEHLKQLGISIVRACLWKPRTSPGWDGIGIYGLSLLLDETLSRGVIPATEILTAVHAQMVVDTVAQFGDEASMIVWIGARNQNHFELLNIVQVLLKGPPHIYLMFKNQMWVDKKHWFGIYEHIVAAQFPRDRLLACHRGFSPGYSENPENLRNIPDYTMSMEIKEKTQVPVLLDPSHIAGKRDLVHKIVEQSLDYDFDGYMVEVHNNTAAAKTDAHQQLSFDELGALLDVVHSREIIQI